MPALCPGSGLCKCDPAGVWRHTITVSTIRADKDGMDDAEFDRAYLNRTRKLVPPPDPNVPAKEWPGCLDAESQVVGDIAIAVDVAPLRTSASVAVYGLRADGLGHAELIDYRSGTPDWIVDRLVELKAKRDPVAIVLDAKGPAASLLLELEKRGIRVPKKADKPKRGDLAVAAFNDVAGACGQFADAVRQKKIRHRDQIQLNVALAGARSRPLGDAWAWARKAADVDISPLVAVTLARWAFETRAHLIGRQRAPLVAFTSRGAKGG
jgi:hypothetical protein